MDMHLEFIVDQTQKYSSWLVQGMASTTPSATPSLAPSLISKDGRQGRKGGREGIKEEGVMRLQSLFQAPIPCSLRRKRVMTRRPLTKRRWR